MKGRWQRYDGGWETLAEDGYIVRVERDDDGDWWAYHGGDDSWQDGPFDSASDAREAAEKNVRLPEVA